MNKNKLILTYCPNFYKIINFDYWENDYISEKLITVYEEFIFNININDEDDILRATTIDKALGKYIDDYIFRKEMKHEILQVKINKDEQNILKAIVQSIIRILDRYEEGFTRKIYISRWI